MIVVYLDNYSVQQVRVDITGHLPALTTQISYTSKCSLCNSRGICLHHAAPNAIHGSFHILLHLVPIGPALRKLVYFLHTPDARESIGISDDSGQLLGVRWVDQVDLGQFTESFEIEEEFLISQALDKLEIVVHVAVNSQCES